LGKTHCLFDANYTNLLTRWADEANLWHANALIDTWVADLCSSFDVTLVTITLATQRWKRAHRNEVSKSFTRTPKKSVD
jgi:hypothetical protein